MYIVRPSKRGGFEQLSQFSVLKEPRLNYISGGLWASEYCFLFTSQHFLHYLSPGLPTQTLAHGASSGVLTGLLFPDSVIAGVLPDRIVLIGGSEDGVRTQPLQLGKFIQPGYKKEMKDGPLLRAMGAGLVEERNSE